MGEACHFSKFEHGLTSAPPEESTSIDQDRPLRWFGIRVKTRSEERISTALQARGYAPFLPTYKCVNHWSDRKKVVDAPLFPGYLFCRFDPGRRLPLMSTPGVLEIVGAGKTPASIPEHEIHAIRVLVESGLPAQPWPFVQEGDRVSVTDGPLRGIEGIVTKMNNHRQLVLSIELLQRSVSVAVDPCCIQPLA